MIMIVKRNGTKVLFDKSKIINAINKAFIEVDGQFYENDTAKEIADDIEKILYEYKEKDISVESIQDLVEDFLMRSERRDVAKAYIRYRYKKEVARNHSDEFIETVGEKIKGTNNEKKNANVDEISFGGRYGEAADVLMRKYALDHYISDMAKNNHLNNEIYIHDLNSYAIGSHNCLSVPFDKLLAEGFNTRQTDVRPAGSVNTAFQLVAVIFQLQSLQQFGGVSATHLDWTMVPYVRKSFWKHVVKNAKYFISPSEVDYITKVVLKGLEFSNIPIEPYNHVSVGNAERDASYLLKHGYRTLYDYAYEKTLEEAQQAVEGMYHNLNTLQSRSGNQLPFTSINYGTCILPEGRLITKALIEGSIKGVGKLHKTSIFPCGIFQCMKGVNRKLGDPNYDLFQLALKSTAQRLYPNYANVDWSGNAGYDINDPRTYFSTINKTVA